MKNKIMGLALGILIFNAFIVNVWAQEKIDFNALPEGTIVDQVFGDGGSGPIGVSGVNPQALGLNAAVIFDSANPNGDPCGGGLDLDLGTPNINFGGPGVGDGGASGPFANTVAQGKILIINEACGLGGPTVDRPNDADVAGATLNFDFSAIGSVTVTSIFLIDVEADETGAQVSFFDADNNPITTVNLPDTGDNGVATTTFNVAGVVKMQVLLNGSGAIDDIIFERPQDCSIGDYVWEDANRDGCQDPEESPIEGVEVKLFENCGSPTMSASTTTDADGFYEFTGLDCSKEYRVQFGPAGSIYDYTIPDQECVESDPDASDMKDSDCSKDDGFSGCITFPDPVNAPNNPTIDCGYVCEGKIGDYVWLDENADGCQDEVDTGIAGVEVTLSEDCVDPQNPKTVQTDADGFYMFEGLCPGEYFVEFGNGRPNTDPGQSCDNDPDVSDEKDSNCGDEKLQCVELTRDNPEDPTIDCGKVGPCLELEKRVSGDGGQSFFDADNCSDDDVPFTVDDAVYELEVTNCGREAVDLDKIVDLDLGINLILDPVVTIPPGGSVTFTNDAGQTQGKLQKEGACPNAENQFENTATVSGTGAGSGAPVEATDPACVKCGPCIDLLKEISVNGGQDWSDANEADCSDGPTTPDPAEYRLTIANCGGEVLVDVVIDDVVLGITDFSVPGPLGIGETITLTKDDIAALAEEDLCPLTPDDPGVDDSFLRNIARVDAQGTPSGIPVFDEDPACVKCCPLEVEKEVFPETIECVDSGTDSGTDGDPDACICPCEDSGTDTGTDGEAECIVEKVTYTYTIRNTGDVTLTDVTVFDDQLGGIIAEISELGPGAIEIITVEDVCLCEDTTNKVTVTAILGDGILCTAMDSATVTTDLDCIDTGTDRP